MPSSASVLCHTYDAVVIGLGIMGSSAVHHLSARGLRVLGVEARGPLHASGSSHGQTRIFRRAYWEGEQYVPLLSRSFDGWMALDDATPDTIALRSGGLFIGRPESTLVQGSRQTAERCGIAHEMLGADDVGRRFPAFRVQEGAVAIYEPDALVLFAERARLAYLSRAVQQGAHVVHGRFVQRLDSAAGSVSVVGEDWQVSCGAAVVTTGGWMGDLLPRDVASLITPMRIPVFEFDVAAGTAADHLADRFPVFLYEDIDGALVYGLPRWQGSGGLKIGFHNRQLSPVGMDDDRDPPTDAERLELWRTVSELLPGVRPTGSGTACVYTMTPDESFFIGPSEREGIYYASACSGHGFKFAPGIGEALAQLVVDGTSEVDLVGFAPGRLHRDAT